MPIVMAFNAILIVNPDDCDAAKFRRIPLEGGFSSTLKRILSVSYTKYELIH